MGESPLKVAGAHRAPHDTKAPETLGVDDTDIGGVDIVHRGATGTAFHVAIGGIGESGDTDGDGGSVVNVLGDALGVIGGREGGGKIKVAKCFHVEPLKQRTCQPEIKGFARYFQDK